MLGKFAIKAVLNAISKSLVNFKICNLGAKLQIVFATISYATYVFRLIGMRNKGVIWKFIKLNEKFLIQKENFRNKCASIYYISTKVIAN